MKILNLNFDCQRLMAVLTLLVNNYTDSLESVLVKINLKYIIFVNMVYSSKYNYVIAND